MVAGTQPNLTGLKECTVSAQAQVMDSYVDRKGIETMLTHRRNHSSAIEWLRYVRRTLGLTQKEFAGRLGYSTNMVRKIEAGDRRPSAMACERLADLLQCSAVDRADLQLWLRGGWAH